ncbi:MAG: hypothetical protein JW841_17635 [Deltaproteobacteria bacterium]|nr:hypothetical protein [Deltaproteobacteria bacterium]
MPEIINTCATISHISPTLLAVKGDDSLAAWLRHNRISFLDMTSDAQAQCADVVAIESNELFTLNIDSTSSFTNHGATV